jgi:hypothetical protein
VSEVCSIEFATVERWSDGIACTQMESPPVGRT